MAGTHQGIIDERTGNVYGAGQTGQIGQTPGVGTTSASTGTGTSTADGMDPYTGFASQYAPGALQNTIYDNPWYILKDVFSGMQSNSPGYQYLRDFGADPLSIYNIMSGSNQTLDGGAGDFTNFMAEMYKNLGTPGGQGFNAKELMGNIFGASDESSLGNILNAGDMNTQIRTLFNLLRDVANVGMNPLAAGGYTSAVARAGDDYGNAMLKSSAGDTVGPTEWLAQNMPWLAGAGSSGR